MPGIRLQPAPESVRARVPTSPPTADQNSSHRDDHRRDEGGVQTGRRSKQQSHWSADRDSADVSKSEIGYPGDPSL